MDPVTLTWFLTLVLHAGGAGCCASQIEMKMPPKIECKAACTISPFDICKAIAAANTELAASIRCLAEPK